MSSIKPDPTWPGSISSPFVTLYKYYDCNRPYIRRGDGVVEVGRLIFFITPSSIDSCHIFVFNVFPLPYSIRKRIFLRVLRDRSALNRQSKVLQTPRLLRPLTYFNPVSGSLVLTRPPIFSVGLVPDEWSLTQRESSTMWFKKRPYPCGGRMWLTLLLVSCK